MNVSLIGEQISKFRKAAGLTQEELGKAVGVSTQAVSRWECGGAPDVALLPAIADRLGVTIDTLFGREGGTPQDITELARSWIRTVRVEKRVDSLCRLIWELTKKICYSSGLPLSSIAGIGYLDRCEFMDSAGERSLLRTCVSLTDGLIYGICAEDMSFMTLWPEPETGWGAFLPDRDVCRALFACLARPGCLELLEHLYSVKQRYYVPGIAAKQTGRPAEEVEGNMEALEKLGLVKKLDLELETGEISAYLLQDSGAFIPFLYLARCLVQKNPSHLLLWNEHERPPLAQRDTNEKELSR